MSIAEMRKQLDALMGTNRDGDNISSGSFKHFSDRDVCRYFLSGLCPHDTFMNTKKEIGSCSNLHSEPLKIQYEVLDIEKRKEYGYERQLARFLDELVRECNLTIEQQEKKLKESEEEKMENDPVSRQIMALQSQAEKLGEEGNVDEYMKINSEIKILEQKRLQLQVLQIPTGVAGEVIQLHGTQSQRQKLRVCEICSCYLSKFDSEKRLADHYNGKLHQGYVAIREKLEELKTQGFFSPDDRKDKSDSSTVIRRSYERHREDPYSRSRERDHKTSISRDGDHHHHKSHSSSHDRDYKIRSSHDRDYKNSSDRSSDRDRDRDRERDRNYKNSRDHDRERREYDRGYRSGRDKDYNRDYDRGHRSRDGDKDYDRNDKYSSRHR